MLNKPPTTRICGCPKWEEAHELHQLDPARTMAAHAGIAEILVKNVTITNDEVAIDMRLDGFTTIANTFTKGDFL